MTKRRDLLGRLALEAMVSLAGGAKLVLANLVENHHDRQNDLKRSTADAEDVTGSVARSVLGQVPVRGQSWPEARRKTHIQGEMRPPMFCNVAAAAIPEARAASGDKLAAV